MRSSCVLLTPFVLAIALCANAAGGLSITGSAVNGGHSVVLYGSLRDAADKPITGLTELNFSASVDGKSCAIQSVRPTDRNRPDVLVIALDTSRSMAGEPFNMARELACDLIDQLAPEDLVTVITFGSGVRLLSDFENNKEVAKQAIREVKADSPRTELNSAVLACVRHLAKAPYSRVAVVILSDGEDRGSNITLGQALAEAGRARVPFYTIGYGPDSKILPLIRISELTAGGFWSSASPELATRVYQVIREDLKDQYAVALRGPFSLGRHHFQLETLVGGRRSVASRGVRIPRRPKPEGDGLPIGALFAGGVFLIAVSLTVAKLIRAADAGGDDLDESEVVSDQPAQSERDREHTNAEGKAISSTSAHQPLKNDIWLAVVSGPHQGARLRLTGKPIVIGRNSASDLALVSDSAVSRSHARITFNDSGQFVLRDLDSHNGTAVNGHILGTQSIVLGDGDRLTLGASELIYRDMRPHIKLH